MENLYLSHINNTKIMLFQYDEDISNHMNINEETLKIAGIFLVEVKKTEIVNRMESDECKIIFKLTELL